MLLILLRLCLDEFVLHCVFALRFCKAAVVLLVLLRLCRDELVLRCISALCFCKAAVVLLILLSLCLDELVLHCVSVLCFCKAAVMLLVLLRLCRDELVLHCVSVLCFCKAAGSILFLFPKRAYFRLCINKSVIVIMNDFVHLLLLIHHVLTRFKLVNYILNFLHLERIEFFLACTFKLHFKLSDNSSAHYNALRSEHI